MEGEGGSRLVQVAVSVFKRKRSSSVRRPRQSSSLRLGRCDPSPLSSTPSSDNTNKLSPDYSSGYDGGSGSSRRKEIFSNNPPIRVASLRKFDNVTTSRKNKRDRVAEFDVHYASSSSRDQSRNGSEIKRCSEGVLAPSNWKNSTSYKENSEMNLLSPERYEHNLYQSAGTSNTLVESKLKKVKLKVGGVTRTIHAKSNVETRNIGSSLSRPSRSSELSRPQKKMICQDDSDDNRSPREKGSGSLGDLWNDVDGVNFSRNKLNEGDLSGRQRDQQQGVSSTEPIRKSRRVPKRRVLDAEFDDGNEKDDDDSSKKRKFAKVTKNRSISYEADEDYHLSRMNKDSQKKSRSGRLSDDTDYVEEEEALSDDDEEQKRQKKLPLDSSPDVRLEPLTTRQRAMQPGKDGNVLSLIEFPDGLPPAPTRKQKQKLSEVEQAKKAEAALRRKMQVEKAARESEAAAIRKILGLDSDKKKAEKEKAQAEKAKAANSQISEGKNIRWIMGPNGTVVTFPEDVGLPKLFDSKPCSYPPQREKCAGPSCENPYKYRDSKLNLPLCSLQCYKAVQGTVN